MPIRLVVPVLVALLTGCSPGPDTPSRSTAESDAGAGPGSATDSGPTGDGERIVLEIDGETATCTGVAERQCLKVRTPGEEVWQLFYSPIEGFDFEPGLRAVLEVDRIAVSNPPADASRFRYRLVRVVSREPVS